jgi:predicted kinase
MGKMTLVCGPPGSGKTTYVRERLNRGDLIVDLDDIWSAFTGQQKGDHPDGLLPYICEARDAVLKKWGQNRRTDIWFIHSAASRRKRRAVRRMFGADVVVLETTPNECVRRATEQGRDPVKTFKWATAWWHEYQKQPKDPEDEVIRER